MKNKKKGWKILAAVLGISIVVFVGSVTAYLTNGARITNEFGVSKDEHVITEKYDPPKTLEKGANLYKKEVAIKNSGDSPQYVRVFLDFSDGNLRDISGIDVGDGLYYTANHMGLADDMEAGDHTIKKESFTENLPEHWIYIPYADEGNTDSDASELGGYFYYTEQLEPGKSTESLMKKVLTYFDKEEDIKEYEIIVAAQTVQTVSKDGVDFEETGSDPAWRLAWREYTERK